MTSLADAAQLLDSGGVGALLEMINGRTPFRYTGIYRFDGETLRNVALFDRRDPGISQGSDAPMIETFCAITGKGNEPVVVFDGHHDARYPWMQANAVESYCGVPVRDLTGAPVGTLCHFDLQPCQAHPEEVIFLSHVARLLVGRMGAS
jgi:GAF domain-containing protein